MNDCVAITGMGVICSLGITKDSIESSIRSGKRPFAPIKRFDASNYIVNLAAEVPSLQAQVPYTIPPHSSRTDVLALAAAATALPALKSQTLNSTGVAINAINEVTGAPSTTRLPKHLR